MKEIRFAENLKELRKSRGWSQKDLADRIGVNFRTVSTWENGSFEPSFSTLAKLCEIFDESFENLLT